MTAGTVGIILFHPTEANEFASGLVSGYTSAYLDWKTELPPNTLFEAFGEVVGKTIGEISLEVNDKYGQLDSGPIDNELLTSRYEQRHPKK